MNWKKVEKGLKSPAEPPPWNLQMLVELVQVKRRKTSNGALKRNIKPHSFPSLLQLLFYYYILQVSMVEG